MAYSAPSDDHRLCTIALVSEEGVWTADAHSASRVIAGIVAAHLRHAADQARFWALAKAVPVGIVQLDAGGLCTFTNDRWSEMTGMTAQDALGAGWAAALHPEDATRIEREWAVAAARGTELHTSCRLIAPDSTEIWADTTAIPVRNAAGQPAGFVSAVIDVTDRKRAESGQESQCSSD